jgi:hypothetical protein
MTVLDFDASRRASTPHGNRTCSCGGEWFELRGSANEAATPHGALVFAEDGRVSGFTGVPHCLVCGEMLSLV